MAETDISSLANNLHRSIRILIRYMEVCDQFCVRELGVTATQGYILLEFQEDETISMNDLSGRMGVANSTMTRMIDQLIQKGMVERKNDDQDRRIVLIQLTENGMNVKDKLKKSITDFFLQVTNDLPAGNRNAISSSMELLNASIIHTLKSCCTSDQ